MPYKSDAQRKFFHAAEEKGEIPHKTVQEFDQASKGKELPEHKVGLGHARMHQKMLDNAKKLWRGGGC